MVDVSRSQLIWPAATTAGRIVSAGVICVSAANDDGCKIPPWEEDNGLYGIMVSKIAHASRSLSSHSQALFVALVLRTAAAVSIVYCRVAERNCQQPQMHGVHGYSRLSHCAHFSRVLCGTRTRRLFLVCVVTSLTRSRCAKTRSSTTTARRPSQRRSVNAQLLTVNHFRMFT